MQQYLINCEANIPEKQLFAKIWSFRNLGVMGTAAAINTHQN
jgi:hypothetical protein